MSLTMNETGIRKSAILLIQLGHERAAKVLGHLEQAEVEAISAEIARLLALDADETDAVVTEFHELAGSHANIANGGPDFARAILEESLGRERADSVLQRVGASRRRVPFEFLKRVDGRQLLPILRREHPQVVAVVLAHMPSDRATTALSGLDPDLQADVAHRIATIGHPAPEVLRALEDALVHRLSSVEEDTETPRVGGVDPLVCIINNSDRATERLIVEALEQRDPALAEEVKSRMFGFEDIVLLQDKDMQLVLRQLEVADLALALKGVGEEIRTKVTTNMSERAAENLVEESELLGAVRLAQVEEAQNKVVRKIRELKESGEITVRRGADEEEYVS